MPINLASCILKDFMYQQDKQMHYVFNDDKLVLVDRDEVADSILKNIDAIFDKYIGNNTSIERTYDPFALNQAMCRYSRDIFGESRLHARVLHFGNKYSIQDNDLKELANYEDYGLKINSQSPYVHRRIACIFYWFSVLKPFRAVIKSPIINDSTYEYLECHNEYTTYILALMVLACLNLKIDIHEHLPSFKQFMYDLHYRKISRSSLEFFLINHIYPKGISRKKKRYEDGYAWCHAPFYLVILLDMHEKIIALKTQRKRKKFKHKGAKLLFEGFS